MPSGLCSVTAKGGLWGQHRSSYNWADHGDKALSPWSALPSFEARSHTLLSTKSGDAKSPPVGTGARIATRLPHKPVPPAPAKTTPYLPGDSVTFTWNLAEDAAPREAVAELSPPRAGSATRASTPL